MDSSSRQKSKACRHWRDAVWPSAEGRVSTLGLFLCLAGVVLPASEQAMPATQATSPAPLPLSTLPQPSSAPPANARPKTQPLKKESAANPAQSAAPEASDQRRPSWLADVASVLSAILSWPVAVFASFLVLAFSGSAARRLRDLFGGLRSLKLFGAELTLSEEVARSAQEAIPAYRKQVREAFDRHVEQTDLRVRLQTLFEDRLPKRGFRLRDVRDLRCTIHVPDVLFSDTLYQLLDYYPRGGGAGRTKSIRFGIIGKVWRSRESDVQGDVPTDAKTLVRDWGMTLEESHAAGLERKSFVSVLLREGGVPLGVLFIDAPGKDALCPEAKRDALLAAIDAACEEAGITQVLAEMLKDLRRQGPLIRIYD